MLSIEIANQQTAAAIDLSRIHRTVEAILRDGGIVEAQLSIALVDDATIHQLNRKYLQHDDPTDVLSFVLEREGMRLEGEVIASGETAARLATQYGWPPGDELLLYVVHGALHLVGYDDTTEDSRAAMRQAEDRYLSLAGAPPRRAAETNRAASMGDSNDG